MNVLNFPEGQRLKAKDVSPWYGVYLNSNYKFSNFVLIRHEKASGVNKLVDLAVGGLDLALKAGLAQVKV